MYMVGKHIVVFFVHNNDGIFMVAQLVLVEMHVTIPIG